MSPSKLRIMAFVGLLVLMTEASAQSIFSQSPPDATEERVSDFAASFSNQQAQRFTLSSDSNIQAIVAWGNHRSGTPADDFTVRFFLDSGGAPDSTPFQESTSLTVTREASGLTSTSGATIFKYSINLNTPIALSASTTYYFSIVNNTNHAERWNWQGCAASNNLRWSRGRDGLAWGQHTQNLAFELYDVSLPVIRPVIQVPVMPFWLLSFMVVAVAGIASMRIKGKH